MSSKTASPPSSNRAKILARVVWRDIVLVNFEVDAKHLHPHVPPGTELDIYDDAAFVTLVARTCRGMRPYGMPVPMFGRYLEIYLRFYVKRKVDGKEHRGACLIRDMVSRHSAKWMLRRMFGDYYGVAPLRSRCRDFKSGGQNPPHGEYAWYAGDRWNVLRVEGRNRVARSKVHSTREQFIFGHSYGYSVINNKTCEFPVVHAPWMVWDAASGHFDFDIGPLFGPEWARKVRRQSASVYLAAGGQVEILRPTIVG